MKIRLLDLVYALYSPCNQSFYCDKNTGKVISKLEADKNDAEYQSKLVFLPLPHYSQAFERRCFLSAFCSIAEKQKALLRKYHLSDIQFPRIRNPQQSTIEEDWENECRVMYEDLKIEKKFQDYLFCKGLSEALLWCETNKFEKDFSGIEHDYLGCWLFTQ